MKRLIVILSVALFCTSCSNDAIDRKDTFPVTGRVLIDGDPVKDVAVRCLGEAGIDKKSPTVSSAFTDAEGKFEISTYESGDGVPVGKYVLTFEWGKLNLMSMQYGGPDKLKGKYSNPKTSQHKFEVVAGQPKDLGTLELSTK